MSYEQYKKLCTRGKLIKTKQGRGKGNEAWLSFYDFTEAIKLGFINELGDPKKVISKNDLKPYILPSPEATCFFDTHRTPYGEELSEEKQREKVTNTMIEVTPNVATVTQIKNEVNQTIKKRLNTILIA